MKTSFNPIIDNNSKILILGTMPGEKSLELQQYYGNKGNQFWKLLYSVFNKPFSLDYEDRKQLVKNNYIALWDVLKNCEREGSLDSKIKNEEANNFDNLYAQYPNIKYIFFSSIKASQYYDRYVGRKNYLQYFILPSPSGANATKSFNEKLVEWNKILTYIK